MQTVQPAEARRCPTCGERLSEGAAVCPKDGTPVADPLIGAEVGGYRIEGAIGSGGLGVVYRAVQPVIGKAVAIKVLRWEFARDPDQVRRLVEEARAVNAVRHRGIVDVFGFGQLPDGRQYLAMELLEGEPLDRFIAKRGCLPPDEALLLFDELLDALGGAHRAGVIHRDLKPSNVFVVRPTFGKPFVKLLDFGLAKVAPSPQGETPQTHNSSLVGTPAYMAPEQARSQAVSPRTDLYACGVVLFEMLTGHRPFDSPNVFETIHLHLSAPVPRPSSFKPGVPEALDELVLSLMRKNPDERPFSAEIVRAEVERLRLGLVDSSPTLAAVHHDSSPGTERTVRRTRQGLSAVVSWSGGALAALATRLGLRAAGLSMALVALLAAAAGAWYAERRIERREADAPAPAPAPVGLPAPAQQPAPAAEPRPSPTPAPVAVPAKAPAAAPKPQPRPADRVEPAPAPKPAPAVASAPEPAPAPTPATGRVKLHVFPWADIYVDGQLAASGAMDWEGELANGVHRLRLANPNLAEHDEALTVVGGQTLEKRIRLKAAHAP